MDSNKIIYYNRQYFTPTNVAMDNSSRINPTNFQPSEGAMHRLVYINKDFKSAPSTKVLVNPNFSRKVHINPKFSGTSTNKPNIYINPSILQQARSNIVTNQVIKSSVNVIASTNKIVQENNTFSANAANNVKPAFQVSRYTKINKITTNATYKPENIKAPIISTKNNFVKLPNTRISPNKKIVNSKYKIIRSSNKKLQSDVVHRKVRRSMCSPKKLPIQSEIKIGRTLNKVINSKYKIVRSTDKKPVSDGVQRIIKRTICGPKKHPPNNSKISQFKLDNRTNTSTSNTHHSVGVQSGSIMKSKYKLMSKAYLMSLDPKRDIIKQTKLNSNAKLKPSTIPRILKKNGCVYRFKPNYNGLNSLRRSGDGNIRKIKIGNLSYLRTSSKTYEICRGHNKVKINRKNLSKNNMPCMIYNKTGACQGIKKGTCNKKHDAEQISICTWFLQGCCRNKECKLSHKVSPEKMPTCKFFLEGLCHNEDCQYLHVKLSVTTEICKSFLTGYCVNGLKCDKRHQFLCPSYEKGVCKKKNCAYPHGKAVRQYKDRILNKIARSTKVKKVNKKTAKIKKCITKVDEEVIRYYQNETNVNDDVNVIDDIQNKNSIINRPKLGMLPSFIPLDD